MSGYRMKCLLDDLEREKHRAQRAEAECERLRGIIHDVIEELPHVRAKVEGAQLASRVSRAVVATPPPEGEPCDVCGGEGRRAFPNANNTIVHHPFCTACKGTGKAPHTPEQSRRHRAQEIAKDEDAVDRFAEAMKEKLAKAREKGRGGWDDPEQCPAERLATMLIEHLRKGNEGTFEDVANFAMMLHQRGEAPETLARAWLEADKAASDRGYRYAMKAAVPEQAHGDALVKVKREVFDQLHHPADSIGDCDITVGDVRQALTASGVPYVPEEVRRLPEQWRRNPPRNAQDCAYDLESVLASAPADGWKLVPVEPTQDMWNAANLRLRMLGVVPRVIHPVWESMIAAAPTDGRE